tara:strand:+ start:4518 stop:4733 length:216 start_codon:yes stop_codon:yes gene_type:complete
MKKDALKTLLNELIDTGAITELIALKIANAVVRDKIEKKYKQQIDLDREVNDLLGKEIKNLERIRLNTTNG